VGRFRSEEKDESLLIFLFFLLFLLLFFSGFAGLFFRVFLGVPGFGHPLLLDESCHRRQPYFTGKNIIAVPQGSIVK
jgi:hypothetical protein